MAKSTLVRPTKARTLTRLLLGGFMTFAGISHLTFNRKEFQAQVPKWFPLDVDVTVLASGVAEISLGAGFLALPKRRRFFGILLTLFFIAIFPGNIAQYTGKVSAFGLDTDQKRFVRLFFQPVLIAAALFGGQVFQNRKKK